MFRLFLRQILLPYRNSDKSVPHGPGVSKAQERSRNAFRLDYVAHASMYLNSIRFTIWSALQRFRRQTICTKSLGSMPGNPSLFIS